ncbi:unnamed protein product [Prunus armeniaca]
MQVISPSYLPPSPSLPPSTFHSHSHSPSDLSLYSAISHSPTFSHLVWKNSQLFGEFQLFREI